eukprot:Clim_evm80s236 gene=Clim_evmTU80s236
MNQRAPADDEAEGTAMDHPGAHHPTKQETRQSLDQIIDRWRTRVIDGSYKPTPGELEAFKKTQNDVTLCTFIGGLAGYGTLRAVIATTRRPWAYYHPGLRFAGASFSYFVGAWSGAAYATVRGTQRILQVPDSQIAQDLRPVLERLGFPMPANMPARQKEQYGLDQSEERKENLWGDQIPPADSDMSDGRDSWGSSLPEQQPQPLNQDIFDTDPSLRSGGGDSIPSQQPQQYSNAYGDVGFSKD